MKEHFILNTVVPKQLKYSVLAILNKTLQFKFSCVFQQTTLVMPGSSDSKTTVKVEKI